MVYETLLYKSGTAALARGQSAPAEQMAKDCKSYRGCYRKAGIWYIKINQTDLKWRSECEFHLSSRS